MLDDKFASVDFMFLCTTGGTLILWPSQSLALAFTRLLFIEFVPYEAISLNDRVLNLDSVV